VVLGSVPPSALAFRCCAPVHVECQLGNGPLGRNASGAGSVRAGILVFVRSYPTTAQVQVNDQPAGTTPLSIELQPGTNTLHDQSRRYPSADGDTSLSKDIPRDLEVTFWATEAPSPAAQVQQTPRPAAPSPVKPRPLCPSGNGACPVAQRPAWGASQSSAIRVPEDGPPLRVGSR